MSRTTKDGIEARFTREEAGLSLVMTSPRWELEKGTTYPVEFAAGSTSWKADVTATIDAVRVALTDQLFNDALKKANSLEVRAAGKTITVSLNRSAAAFARLERCYQTNNKAGETNPVRRTETVGLKTKFTLIFGRIVRSADGRPPGSDSVCLGSNPSPPAKLFSHQKHLI